MGVAAGAICLEGPTPPHGPDLTGCQHNGTEAWEGLRGCRVWYVLCVLLYPKPHPLQ